MNQKPTKISVFMAFSGDGGVERMMINLIEGLIAKGYCLDLVLAKSKGSFIKAIPDPVNIIKTGTNHTLTSLPALIRYLKKEQPAVLLTAKHRAGIVALIARKLAGGTPCRIVLRLGTTLSASLQGRSIFKRWIWYTSMRLFYPWADKIVAVSKGVAEDIIHITAIPETKLQVIHNPVIITGMERLSKQEIEHPWFHTDNPPIIIGIGRLTTQKDFPTLIRAFAIVCKTTPCRLMILGDGNDRGMLEKLVSELDIADRVVLAGFVTNPYAYLNKAKLFVLSSRWEGSPNAFTEAMAIGIPVVATDCPSGPREILHNGRYGKLVPVSDVGALAGAIEETLHEPLTPEVLQSAVEDYRVPISTQHYLEALGLE